MFALVTPAICHLFTFRFPFTASLTRSNIPSPQLTFTFSHHLFHHLLLTLICWGSFSSGSPPPVGCTGSPFTSITAKPTHLIPVTPALFICSFLIDVYLVKSSCQYQPSSFLIAFSDLTLFPRYISPTYIVSLARTL